MTSTIVARVRVTGLYLATFALPLLLIAVVSGVFA